MFEPFADVADLAARNIAVPDGFDAGELLLSASDAIRDAAGCPITRTTSVVDLSGSGDRYLDLPGVPIVSVASVTLNAVAVTDWTLRDGALHRWPRWCADGTFEITYTHGLLAIPRDIVDLTCGLAAMAMSDAGGGYGSVGVTQSVRLGTAGETFFAPIGGSLISPMAIPERVRERLRARFGTSAVMVGWRGR